MGMEEDATLTPTQLLQLAETHLRLRNFSLCRQYALESQQPNDPHRIHNHRHAAKLLAVANILSAAASSSDRGPTNLYSILQLDTFCDDFALIRSHFDKLCLVLEPFKVKFSLANEALGLLMEAYNSLSDPSKKSHLDSELALQLSNQMKISQGEGTFWTFCPYCFYMYEYGRVYEGCCLRCQNETCRRAFHGVSLSSIPKMELDKGQYFSSFGYFPMGFSPSECEGKGKFASWCPIVGLRRIGETRAGSMDLNDDKDGNFLDISDEGAESDAHRYKNEQEAGGERFAGDMGINAGVPSAAGPNVVKPQMMKRKTAGWNAKNLMGRGRRSNDGANGTVGRLDSDGEEDGGYGFMDTLDVGNRSGYDHDAADVKFFEEDGEIFVGLGPADAL